MANISRLKQSYYDRGEKAGRLLAWRIKAQQNEKVFNEIEATDGQDLYKSTPPVNTHLYKTFMDETQLLPQSEEESKTLDQPIEEADLSAAINCMSSGKAPDPDRLHL